MTSKILEVPIKITQATSKFKKKSVSKTQNYLSQYYLQGVHSLIQQQNKLLGDIRERLGTQEEYDKEELDNKEMEKELDKVGRMESTRADELRQLRQFSEQLSRVVV